MNQDTKLYFKEMDENAIMRFNQIYSLLDQKLRDKMIESYITNIVSREIVVDKYQLSSFAHTLVSGSGENGESSSQKMNYQRILRIISRGKEFTKETAPADVSSNPEEGPAVYLGG